jgi:hypothetical protein
VKEELNNDMEVAKKESDRNPRKRKFFKSNKKYC